MFRKSVMNRSSQLKVFDKNRCSTIPVKEFILSKVAVLQPATLLKNEFFRRHFSRVLIIVIEQIFCRTPLNGCFCMEKLQLLIHGFCFIVHVHIQSCRMHFVHGSIFPYYDVRINKPNIMTSKLDLSLTR